MDKKLKEYAALLIELGVNLQQGETLAIACPVECCDLAEEAARAAYERGAERVVMFWSSGKLSKLSYQYQSEKTLTEVPDYLVASRDFILGKKGAYLCIISDEPGLYEGLDAKKIAAASRATGKALIRFRESTSKNETRWCLAAYPNPAWAKKMFPSLPEKEALEKSARIQALMPSFIHKAGKYLRYDRFVYIPNAVSIPAFSARPGAPRKVHTITNVGRVTGRTKRQHLLVEAYGLLAKDFPDWQVNLWGDTYDKTYVTTLKGIIKKQGLENRVHLKGTTKDMASVWKETDIFAFPSHHEGFPLALTEAMGVGIPAVGYRSCPAVNELIHDGEDGYLTDDGAAPFAEALRKLMEDGDKRTAFGNRAKENMKPFAPEVVWDEWNQLIREVAGAGD